MRFLCWVWEAVYIIEGLLRNVSEVQPDKIHADTQGQSPPVFGLAHMLGFELLPRIRNWKDLIFYRPHKEVGYQHIDALFAPDAVINWRMVNHLQREAATIAESLVRRARAGRLRAAGREHRPAGPRPVSCAHARSSGAPRGLAGSP